ncbi:MAG: DUF2505 domain-containing protein [Nocardiaceae bacterium]|nr:DUF2505 domain-containing protein [Nocardiaceae bacterium]
MAREIMHSVHFDAPVEAVHAALTSDEYWAARIAAVGGSLGKLLSSSRDHERFTVHLEQTIRSHHLPALIQRVMATNIKISRTETWGPLVDGESTGKFTSVVEGRRAHMAGSTTLESCENGSKVSFAGVVEVGVPIVGRAIEAVVADQLPRLFKVEDSFSKAWVASH